MNIGINFQENNNTEMLLFGKCTEDEEHQPSINLNKFNDIELLLFGEKEYSQINDEQIEDSLTVFKQKLATESLENFDDLDKDLEEQSQSKDDILENAVIDFNAGYAESYDIIYKHYKPIMARYGNRYNDADLATDILDYVLLNAVKTFDNTAKTKFNTYFWKCVHNYVNCVKIHNNAQKRAHNKDMKSLNEKARYNNDSSENDLEVMIEDPELDSVQKSKELKLSIMGMKDCLKDNEIKILLKVIDNYTLQEIGESLGVTAAAVCMSLKRISKKKVAAKYLMDILKHN